MTTSPIQHVSDTAFWVAVYRAQESERPDALFRDPLAAKLVEGRGREIEARLKGTPKPVSWNVAVRTRLIDDFIAGALADGVDTVVNLGAGLDTRPYRLELPSSLRWFEADFPHMLEFKQQRLKDDRPRCQLQHLPVDLSKAEERRAVLAKAADGARKVLVLTEGVVPYLTLDDAGALAKDLHAQPSFAYWIVDRFTRAFLRFRERAPTAKQLQNAPFKFDPDNWEEFFATRGWSVRELRFLAPEGRRLGRSSPFPWWVKLIRALSPPEQRRVVDEGTGYALLQRV